MIEILGVKINSCMPHCLVPIGRFILSVIETGNMKGSVVYHIVPKTVIFSLVMHGSQICAKKERICSFFSSLYDYSKLIIMFDTVLLSLSMRKSQGL